MLFRSSDAFVASDPVEDIALVDPFTEPFFHICPLDEITTSGDAPAHLDAFEVNLWSFAAEQINSAPGDGDVFVVGYVEWAYINQPAALTDMPVINGGQQDLSSRPPLTIQTDTRAFPVPALNIGEAIVDRVRASVWNPEASEGFRPNIAFGDLAIQGPWLIFGPSDADGVADTMPYEDSDGVDITLAFQLYNNYLDSLGIDFYLERTFSLEFQNTSDRPGYARWSNEDDPQIITGLPRSDKYVGIELSGTAYYFYGSNPAHPRDGEYWIAVPYIFLYDNMTGFTTRAWETDRNGTLTPMRQVLMVDDYTDGQMYISQIQSTRGGGPVEESSYRTVGYPVGEWWDTQWSGDQWRDGDALAPTDFAPNELVTGDLFVGPGSSGPFDTYMPDRWRIACRGPVPDSVFAHYLPEQSPHIVRDANLGDHPPADPGDLDIYRRGPFEVIVDANGGSTVSTPLALYPGINGIVWASPYAGDLFVSEGTITDPQTQASIQSFVADGGGILLSGQDVGWALTLDGSQQSAFLQNVFGIGYVKDDVGNIYGQVNGVTGDAPDMIAPGARGIFPVNQNANPIARPPGTWGSYWAAGEPGTNVDPNELHFTRHHGEPGFTGPNWYCDGAGNWELMFIFLFYDFQPQWPDVIQITDTDPTYGARTAYSYSTGEVAATFKQHPTRDPANDPTYWGGRAGYLAFGLEGVSREYNAYSIGSANFAECLLKRNKVVQCFLEWGRTSAIDGQVTAGYGIPGVPSGTPLANVLVTLQPLDGQSSIPYFGMYTDTNGYFKFRGIPVEQYRVWASAPGLRADHQAGLTIYPEGTNGLFRPATEGFSMLIAPPGNLSGIVVDANQTVDDGQGNQVPMPLEGIRVTARATDANGRDIIDPITSLPIQGEATTDTAGAYTVRDLPSGTSYWVIANPAPKSPGVQANHETDDTTYSPTGTPGLRTVPAGSTLAGVDFQLGAVPGNVRGRVTENNAGAAPIAGAVVRVVGVTPTLSAASTAAGNYNFGGDADSPPDPPAYTIPAGPQSFQVTAPGYQAKTVQATVAANDEIVLNIALDPVPPGGISGRVTTSTGTQGVADITVEAFFGSETTPRGSATTVADGTYTIANVPAGDYTVKARDAVFSRNLAPPDGHDVTVQSGQTVTDVNFSLVPLATFSSGIHIMAAPYDYNTLDSADVLGVAADEFKFAWWAPSRNSYLVYPADEVRHIMRGRGYFVKLTSPAEITRKGDVVDDNVPAAPFDVALSFANGGWNLVGCPYAYEIDWTNSRIIHDGTEMSFADALAANLLAGSIFGYDTQQRDYFLYTSMAPFTGYWVKAMADDVTVRVSNTPVSGVASTRSAGPARSGIDWSMQLIAQAGDYRDSTNFIGVAPKDTGVDMRYDIDEPPMARRFAGQDVTLYFPAVDNDSKARMLAADFRSRLGSSQSWDVVLDTNLRNTDVVLSWPDMRSLPRTFSATLEDLSTGKSVAMRSATQYKFRTADTTDPRRLRVTVRTLTAADNPTPQIMGVDAMTRGVTVSYRLASDVDMRISVLNQAGRVVRTLVADESRAAGVHSEAWDGRDDAGRALPAGEYRIELRATAADGSIGRATARASW